MLGPCTREGEDEEEEEERKKNLRPTNIYLTADVCGVRRILFVFSVDDGAGCDVCHRFKGVFVRR